MSSQAPELIATTDALTAFVAGCRDQPMIAIDTEFVFERTFWPRPGLIQVAHAGGVALIDAVTVERFEPLADLLAALRPLQLFHSGGGDALVLERLAGARPAAPFDTQIAAAFCGLGSSLSYGALVELLLGVHLDKHETRTDWTRRPLSPEQIRYAAEDVEYMLPVASELRSRLAQLGRLGWVEEESAAIFTPDPDRDDSALAYRRLRGLDRLPPPARAVARALASWRELEARARDLPRGFVLRDETLLLLSRRTTVTREELSKLPGYEARRHAQFAALWLTAHAESWARSGQVASDEEDPVRKRDAQLERRLDRAVTEAVALRATELALPAELLLSRRQRSALLEGWAAGPPLSSLLTGFRRDQLGSAIDQAVAALA